MQEQDSQQPPTNVQRNSRKPKYDSYTAPGYNAGPDEWNDVHVEIEKREFDPETGERISKPKIYKTNPEQFVIWLKYRNGYSINEVLHRPGTMEPFEADPWKSQRSRI